MRGTRASLAWRTIAVLAVTAAIGWIDFISGPYIAFSLFYLGPITWAGWRLGRVPAVVVALASAACWLAADLYYQPSHVVWISLWNGLTRLGVFVSMGLLTARVHADRVKTHALLAEARRLARTDSLTGLANSRQFFEQLRDRIEQRPGGTVSLIYIDADNFKRINDSAGHERGDDVLRAIADRMTAGARAGDIVARLGGDEFAIVLSDREPREVDAFVERLVLETEAIGSEHPECGLSLSAGVVHASAPLDPDDLVRQADELMYASKRARRGER